MSKRTNNDHCFEGNGYTYWYHKAAGFQPVWAPRNRRGEVIGFQTEGRDGHAIQNGGIYHPKITAINPGFYYRFVATARHNDPSAGRAFFTGGNWWITRDTLGDIEAFARDADISIATAARRLLAIPPEWGDCGYLGCASLTRKFKAFVGKGKPASGGESPFMVNRSGTLAVPPAHLEIKQFFVPGEPDLLKASFKMMFTQGVLQRGAAVQSVADGPAWAQG